MPDFPVAKILGLRSAKGDVGVEIEIEGRSEFPTSVGTQWRAETDGSLRGYSMEYVLSHPLPIEDLEKALTDLKGKIDNAGSAPKYSERAGVHVHVNVQTMTPKQVYTMALVYYCLENSLVKFCGENREGNHFCLRLADAEYPAMLLSEAIRHNDISALNTEDIRYASLNFCSLFRYGSLEFRAMETRPDFEKILPWAQMLVKIRDYSLKLESWSAIPFEISGEGPTGWARGIFGDDLFRLIDSPSFDQEVMSCLRPVQHILYHREAA